MLHCKISIRIQNTIVSRLYCFNYGQLTNLYLICLILDSLAKGKLILHLSEIILIWLPYILLYRFASNLIQMSIQLQSKYRRAIRHRFPVREGGSQRSSFESSSNRHIEAVQLIEALHVSLCDFMPIDHRFLLTFIGSIITLSVMLLQLLDSQTIHRQYRSPS